MGRWRSIVSCLVLLLVSMAAEPQARQARISVELSSDQGIGVDTQRWYQIFTDLGVDNLRIRGAESGDEVGIQERGKRESPTYAVTGRIAAGNVLLLPGGKFTPRDSAGLKQWLKNLTEQGVDGVTGKPARFGLTEVQLREVEEDLKQPIGFSTLDLPADKAVAKITALLRHEVAMAPGAARVPGQAARRREPGGILGRHRAGDDPAPGRADLCAERPEGKSTQYRIGPPTAGHDAWPPGRASEKSDRELVPDLFKFIHVEIDEAPVAEAIQKIQERLEIPFLWDHYALESQAIDPAQTVVKLATKKLHYAGILQKILSQAKLQKSCASTTPASRFCGSRRCCR